MKVAIIVLADTDTHESYGRAVNAMIAVKEFKIHNDDVKLIFDGAATKWLALLAKPNHKYHNLFSDVKDNISAVCSYCANAFGVKSDLEKLKVNLTEEFEGHPSVRNLIKDRYQVITY